MPIHEISWRKQPYIKSNIEGQKENRGCIHYTLSCISAPSGIAVKSGIIWEWIMFTTGAET